MRTVIQRPLKMLNPYTDNTFLWGEKAQNSATISIIIALFTIVPAICYLLSAIIAKRYYSLTTHNLKTVMEQLAQGKRRCQQQFTSQEVQN